jgi:hypothetical protein
MGIETVVPASKQKAGATLLGFKTIIRLKIMVDPDVAYVSWSKGMVSMGVTDIVLKRDDFPSLPFPHAVAKEDKFIRDSRQEFENKAKMIGGVANLLIGGFGN